MSQNLDVLRNLVRLALISKVENFAQSVDGFLRFCTPKFDANAMIKALEMSQSAAFSAKTTTGKPAAKPVRAYGSTSNPTQYEVRHEFMARQMLDLPRLAAEIATKAWDHFWNQINTEAWTLIMCGRTTAHPENGVSGSGFAAVGGGVVYAVDNFSMTYLDTTTGEQTNDHNLACSSANISTLLAKRRTYKAPSGKVEKPVKPPLGFCAPGLETLFKDLVAQSGRLYTGDGAESGYKGRIQDVLVAPADVPAMAADGWGLLYTEEVTNTEGGTETAGPVACHIRTPPWVKIDQLEGTDDISVYCSGEYDVWYRTGVDQLLFYSEP